jgi:hypothetical protein
VLAAAASGWTLPDDALCEKCHVTLLKMLFCYEYCYVPPGALEALCRPVGPSQLSVRLSCHLCPIHTVMLVLLSVSAHPTYLVLPAPAYLHMIVSRHVIITWHDIVVVCSGPCHRPTVDLWAGGWQFFTGTYSLS